MSLLLGIDFDVFPAGAHRDELERFATGIQTWANRQVGGGSWTHLSASDVGVTAVGTTATMRPFVNGQGSSSTYVKYTRLGNAVTLLWKVLITPAVATSGITLRLPQFVVFENALTSSQADSGVGVLIPCQAVLTPDSTVSVATSAQLVWTKVDGTNFAAATEHSFYGQIVFEAVPEQ